MILLRFDFQKVAQNEKKDIALPPFPFKNWKILNQKAKFLKVRVFFSVFFLFCFVLSRGLKRRKSALGTGMVSWQGKVRLLKVFEERFQKKKPDVCRQKMSLLKSKAKQIIQSSLLFRNLKMEIGIRKNTSSRGFRIALWRGSSSPWVKVNSWKMGVFLPFFQRLLDWKKIFFKLKLTVFHTFLRSVKIFILFHYFGLIPKS